MKQTEARIKRVLRRLFDQIDAACDFELQRAAADSRINVLWLEGRLTYYRRSISQSLRRIRERGNA